MKHKKGLATGILAAALLTVAPGIASAENKNADLLSTGCVVCHGQGGNSQGYIPAINELSAKAIAERMREFRDGKRAGTIMPKIAKGYTDAQIDAMAGHFGAK